MEKPNNFDNTKAFADFIQLAPGGYACKIVGVEEAVSKNGNPMLKIALDINEGEEAGRFSKEFKDDSRAEKKWPCIAYQLTTDKDGNTSRGFKGFIECVEGSNKDSIEWGDNFCKSMKGKLVGVLFGREQYENKKGEIKWITKYRRFETVDTIKKGEFAVPGDKALEKKDSRAPEGFTPLDDSDIPF